MTSIIITNLDKGEDDEREFPSLKSFLDYLNQQNPNVMYWVNHKGKP